ncbi:MAG TPA: hypothetical protein VKK79_02595 [Candidatus Lokiarchaeia archaeon]|nr:hypothetical protein [Candidatus Lokiarchaeia archaeon]
MDIIKFFQSYIRQMVKIGGINLPKTISSAMGHDLAIRYLDHGVADWKEGLTGMISGMGGSIEINEEEGHWTAKILYPTEFCPIGGQPGEQRSEVTAEAICKPYVSGFINAFGPKVAGTIKVNECMVRDCGNCCNMEFTFTD